MSKRDKDQKHIHAWDRHGYIAGNCDCGELRQGRVEGTPADWPTPDVIKTADEWLRPGEAEANKHTEAVGTVCPNCPTVLQNAVDGGSEGPMPGLESTDKENK